MTTQDKYWLIYANMVGMYFHPKNERLEKPRADVTHDLATIALYAATATELGENTWRE